MALLMWRALLPCIMLFMIRKNGWKGKQNLRRPGCGRSLFSLACCRAPSYLPGKERATARMDQLIVAQANVLLDRLWVDQLGGEVRWREALDRYGGGLYRDRAWSSQVQRVLGSVSRVTDPLEIN